MNIIKKITSLLFSSDDARDNQNVTAEIKPERDVEVFGRDELTRQRLFEKWACRDEWSLQDEGIPLLLGLDPETYRSIDTELSSRLDDLREHAWECVRKKLLPVINAEAPAEEWQVKPVDLYSWATISRIPVPAELGALMDFIRQTIKSVDVPEKAETNKNDSGIAYQRHREIVLGAALSLLVSSPDQCKDGEGRVKSSLIARQILDQKERWFADETPLIAEPAMADLIDTYLNLDD